MNLFLAHHVVLALPFALPAVTVAAGVGVMAWTQRGQEDEEL